MKITFIRHSKTKVEPEKSIVLWGLADEGIMKAQTLSKDKAIKRLDVVYSSLQTKAIETMLYLAKPNALPMRTHMDLTEITSFTNKFYSGDEYSSQIEQYYARELDRIAGGETIDEALKRFTGALESIVGQESQSQNIGIVAHGYILSFFTGKYSDLKPYDLHKTIQQPDMAEFDWESKSFTRLWGE
jgi:broad specificity phosphatase PhoE